MLTVDVTKFHKCYPAHPKQVNGRQTHKQTNFLHISFISGNQAESGAVYLVIKRLFPCICVCVAEPYMDGSLQLSFFKQCFPNCKKSHKRRLEIIL